MERIRFIDLIGIDLFDLYFYHLEDHDYNIERACDSYRDIYLDDNYYHKLIFFITIISDIAIG